MLEDLFRKIQSNNLDAVENLLSSDPRLIEGIDPETGFSITRFLIEYENIKNEIIEFLIPKIDLDLKIENKSPEEYAEESGRKWIARKITDEKLKRNQIRKAKGKRADKYGDVLASASATNTHEAIMAESKSTKQNLPNILDTEDADLSSSNIQKRRAFREKLKETCTIEASASSANQITSINDQELLFRLDLLHQNNNLKAIKLLRKIAAEIKNAAQHEGQFGLGEAQSIYKAFEFLFLDLKSDNIMDVTPIDQKIAQMTWSEYLNRLLIKFVDTLMSVPYKYGRQCLNKGFLGKEITKYLTTKGLLNLVRKLKNKAPYEMSEFAKICKALGEDLCIIMEYFYSEQMKTSFSNGRIMLKEVERKIETFQINIEKVKIFGVKNFIHASTVVVESIQRIMAVMLECDVMPDQREVMHLVEFSNIVKLKHEEQKKSSQQFVDNQLRILYFLKNKIRNDAEFMENILLYERLLMEYKQYDAEAEHIRLQEKRLSKEKANYLKDISYARKFLEHETMIERVLAKVSSGLSASEEESELLKYDVPCKEKLAQKERLILEIKEEIFFMEKTLNNFHDTKRILASEIRALKKEMSKTRYQYEACLSEKEEEKRTIETKIQLKIKEIKALRVKLKEFNSDLEFESFRFSNSNLTIPDKEKKIDEIIRDLEFINYKLARYASLEKIIFLHPVQVIAIEIAKIESKKMLLAEKKSKLVLKKEKFSSSDKIEENMEYVKICKRISELEEQERKISGEEMHYREKHAEAWQLIEQYDRINELQAELRQLKDELPNKDLLAKLGDVKLDSVRRYQREYEKHNLFHILHNFQCLLRIANTPFNKIVVIADFSAWCNAGCSEELKQAILKLLPERTIAKLRDFRNKIMHSLDLQQSSCELLVKGDEAVNLASKALDSIIRALIRNVGFLNGKASIVSETTNTNIEMCSNLDGAVSRLPTLLSLSMQGYRAKTPSSSEQLGIFINSIVMGKNIIEKIIQNFIKDELNVTDIAAIIAETYEVKQIEEESKEAYRLNLHLKYDGLLQILGQTLGNLQQYDELLPEIGRLELSVSEDLRILQSFIPIVKEYRTMRTHNIYEDPAAVVSLLDYLDNAKNTICRALDALLAIVKERYENDEELKLLSHHFNERISVDGLYTECKFM